MIILMLVFGGLVSYLSFRIGVFSGSRVIEREILSHIIDSPEYGHEIISHFKKAFMEIK